MSYKFFAGNGATRPARQRRHARESSREAMIAGFSTGGSQIEFDLRCQTLPQAEYGASNHTAALKILLENSVK